MNYRHVFACNVLMVILVIYLVAAHGHKCVFEWGYPMIATVEQLIEISHAQLLEHCSNSTVAYWMPWLEQLYKDYNSCKDYSFLICIETFCVFFGTHKKLRVQFDCCLIEWPIYHNYSREFFFVNVHLNELSRPIYAKTRLWRCRVKNWLQEKYVHVFQY